MAFRTVFFFRACPDAAVTVRALLVESIRFGRHFRILDLIGPMAVQATLWRRGAFFRVFEMAFTAGNERSLIVTGMMMAVEAGCTVAGGMFGMLEKNATGVATVLDADGLIRGGGGKSGVTEKTYNKENDSHAVDQLQISL
jgi:hypothetical protein